MTQTMLPVDPAGTRMPLACTFIAAFVWTVSVVICMASCLLATNDSAPGMQGRKSVQAPPSESRVRPGTRF